MNNNICQFYVILGNKNFIPPIDNNVYINATNINNVNELSKSIIDTYKEKAKSGIKVGSEIIFLIPNDKYRTKTEEIIKELQVNGKVEVITPKEEVVNKIEEQKEILEVKDEEETKNEPQIEITKEEPKKEEVKTEEKTQVFQPNDNIYRGTSTKTTYKNFKKSKPNNTLAIIIFIISLIFFIISLILLFFM